MASRVWLSPVLLAAALTSSLLQIQSCERGDTSLLQLQLVPSDTTQDQIVGFDPDNRNYAVATSSAQAQLTVQAGEADSTVTYQWMVGGQSIEAGVLGVGNGSALLDVPVGRSTLRVGVRP